MRPKASSYILFGFLVCDFEASSERKGEFSELEDSILLSDEPVGPDVAMLRSVHVGDARSFYVGFLLCRGTWSEAEEIDTEKLAAVNTAVNVEALRTFCARHGLEFRDPRFLLLSEYW